MLRSSSTLIPNISPMEIRKRRAVGYGVLALTFVALGAMVTGGAPPLTRLILLPFWWLGVLGFFQAWMKTCTAMAARGLCDLEDGPQPIENDEERAAVFRQGRRVQLWSLVATVVLTTLSFLP